MNTSLQTNKGKLEVICGSMFSGKSEELIRRLKRSKIARRPTIAFKHKFDNRMSTEHVMSHDGSKIIAYAVENALRIADLVPPHVEVVGIDEAQFFSNELISVVLDLVHDNKRVIVAGLNLDFRAIPFDPMPALMAIADTVTKLSAICVLCGQEAYFSQRLVDGKPAHFDDPIIMVGAQETYQARCRVCYVIDQQNRWQKNL